MMIMVVSGVSSGYGLAYTNNTMPIINSIYGWSSSSATAWYDSLIGSSFALGAAIGANAAGHLIQRGRRRAHFVACAIGILGAGI